MILPVSGSETGYAARLALVTGVASLCAILAGPLPSSGQPARTVPRIVIVAGPPTPLVVPWWDAFFQELRALGWTEGQTLAVERIEVDASGRLRPDFEAELARLKPDLLVVSATATALALKQVTSTIPIVLTVPGDPVATGLVQSLARPGGNVTGMSFVGTELTGKQVDLLKETIPGLARVAVLANPANASHAERVREAQRAARALRIELDKLDAGRPEEIDKAFATVRTRRAGALVVLGDPMFLRESRRFLALASKQAVPVMYGLRETVVAGGLMAYSASFTDLFRRAATYVDKILRGARPADLPVEQAAKFELVINLKAARALRLSIPRSVLARADELIDQ
jgi:putative ABC transport system substrate-binding protein